MSFSVNEVVQAATLIALVVGVGALLLQRQQTVQTELTMLRSRVDTLERHVDTCESRLRALNTENVELMRRLLRMPAEQREEG